VTATSAPAEVPVVTMPVVRAYVLRLHKSGNRSRIIGLRAQPVWSGPDTVAIDSSTVHVRPCVSALAVREALIEHADHAGDYLVIVTDVDDLGNGITVHLAYGRLQSVQFWQAIKESFNAHELDPGLVNNDKDWAPRSLIDHEPPSGWPAAPSGTLTRDFALGHLAQVLFGKGSDGDPNVDASHPDAEGLMRWSADPVAVDRWRALPDGVRQGLGRWLGSRTGPAGAWTLRAVEAGRGQDAVPMGLVAGLLWHGRADSARAAEARGMLRSWLGGGELAEREARTWSRATIAYVSAGLANDEPLAVAAVHRAERLLDDLQAADLAPLSDQLSSAFAYRVRAFATAIRNALPAPRTDELAGAERAHAAVYEHDLASRDPRAMTATMALRLLRWIAASPAIGSRSDTVDTLADALDRQVRIDAWVDRALADVWIGDPDPTVGAAYRALAEQVIDRQSAHDQQIGRLVARATEDDADLGRIIPVEEIVAKVVRPLAAVRPVLLIVVDGMSTGVMTKLVDDLRARRWIELVSRDVGGRQAALPVLPTLTSVSRTSLMTGKLQHGSQVTERSGFADAVGLQASIFHKAGLRTPAGDPLSSDLRQALAAPSVKVVCVVLNTVDDSLDKMDPGGTPWGIDAIRYLGPVLDAAREADRVVVLTSDHGHVIERGSELRSVHEAGARWRPATSGSAGDGEIAVRGRRVLLGDGEVILPWREGLRYTTIGAGYHGGVSAAEVAVPLTVHVAAAVDELAGWVPAAPPEPPWWHSPLAPKRPTVVGISEPSVGRRPGPAPTLFDEPVPVDGAEPRDPAAAFVDDLLASEVYATQRARGGRTAPDDLRVRAVVDALLRNDGRLHMTTLAAAAQIPTSRMTTVIAAVRRLLAVDGYEALATDPDGVTLILNVPLLREQFGLAAR
jgi:PglZ domain